MKSKNLAIFINSILLLFLFTSCVEQEELQPVEAELTPEDIVVENQNYPRISFIGSMLQANESMRNVNLQVALDRVSNENAFFSIAFSGSATRGEDYTVAQTRFMIPAGSTFANIQIKVENDNIYEIDETIEVRLVSLDKVQFGNKNSFLYIIRNDDNDNTPEPPVAGDLPQLNFMAASSARMESNSEINLPVILSKPSVNAVSIVYIVSGSATVGSDHELTSSVLTIPAGQIMGNIKFNLRDDNVYEQNEDIIISLSNPMNANIGSASMHTLTIIDNDNQPVTPASVDFSLTSLNGLETNTNVNLPLRLSKISNTPITISYTVNGTATFGQDHNLQNGNLTIPAGVQNAMINFNVINDNEYEADETIVVTLTAAMNGVLGMNKTLVYNLGSEDAKPVVNPSLSFNSSSSMGAEGTTNVSIPISLSNAPTKNVVFNYSVAGTAVNGFDHNLQAGSMTIPAGQTNAAISFNVINDTEYEGAETIIIELTSAQNAILGMNKIFTYTINSDDPMPVEKPVVQFNTAMLSYSEAQGVVTVPISLSKIHDQPVSISVEVSGSATPQTDHTLNAMQSVTIPAGVMSSNISFGIIDDKDYEADENIILKIISAPEAIIGSQAQLTITIQNDDPMPVVLPTVSFGRASDQGSETLNSVNIPVNLDKTFGNDVTVSYQVGGSATPNVDHGLVAGDLTIPAGSTSGVIVLPLINDNDYESNETVLVTLTSAANGTLGTITEYTFTIESDDPMPVILPTVNFAQALSSGAEDRGTVNIPITFSRSFTSPVSISLQISGSASLGSDHNLQSAMITVAPGVTTYNLSFSVTDDMLYEGDETIIITMASINNGIIGAANVHTYTITENDMPPTGADLHAQFCAGCHGANPKIGASSDQILNAINNNIGGMGSLRQRNPAITDDQVILIAEFLAPPPTGEELHQKYCIGCHGANPKIGASVADINNAINSNRGGMRSLLQRDPPISQPEIQLISEFLAPTIPPANPVISFAQGSSSQSEAAGTIQLQVNVSIASATAIDFTYSISGSATMGADFSTTGNSGTIAPNQTSANIPITIINDTSIENTESVVVTITGANGADLGSSLIYTLSILDDDTGSYDPTDCNPNLTADLEAGKLYYSGDQMSPGKCIGCHAVKKQITCKQLKAAFNISGMTALQKPTEQEFVNINAYLNSFTEPPEVEIPEGVVSVVHHMPIATKKLMMNKLTAIFNRPTENAGITNQINNLVRNHASYFSGTCAFKHESCGGSDLDGALAKMLPLTNEPRRGYMTRVCQEVLYRPTSITNALSKTSYDINSAANTARVEELLEVFFPGRQIDDATKQSLVDIYTTGKNEGLSNQDAWRYVLYALCTSPLFEML